MITNQGIIVGQRSIDKLDFVSEPLDVMAEELFGVIDVLGGDLVLVL